MPFLRRKTPATTSAEQPAERDDEAFPRWALSSIYSWLTPFFRGEGPDASGGPSPYLEGHRTPVFLVEVERNLRLTLDWRQGERSALASLSTAMDGDPMLLVKVVDFTLHRPFLGYSFPELHRAVAELDRALREAGSVWCVQEMPGRVEYFLKRRTDPAAAVARDAIAGDSTRHGDHLTRAWRLAYGRSPNPSEPYREAVKAVEVVTIPAVLPTDPNATLGKVIATMRQ